MTTNTARNWHAEHKKTLTRGQRAADVMRNSMGSWPFVGGFILFMLVWAALNTLQVKWDPYPFILLNLFLSMLAGLQGAILLIAAKRQDALAAALAQHDYDTNVAAKNDIESLLEINKRQIVMIQELQQILNRSTARRPRRWLKRKARRGPRAARRAPRCTPRSNGPARGR